MSEDIQEIKENEKQKLDAAADAASQEPPTVEVQPPAERPKKDSGWIVGLVLIAIGGIFLISNFTDFSFNNWWALFILIPAIGSLASAWNHYRQDGRMSAAARGPLIGGIILLFIASIFIFELDWGQIWPVFLIIGGLGALLTAWFKD